MRRLMCLICLLCLAGLTGGCGVGGLRGLHALAEVARERGEGNSAPGRCERQRPAGPSPAFHASELSR